MYVYIYNIEYVTHFWVVPFLLLILSQFWSPLYLHVNIFEPLDNLQWRKLGYFTLDPAPSQPKKKGHERLTSPKNGLDQAYHTRPPAFPDHLHLADQSLSADGRFVQRRSLAPSSRELRAAAGHPDLHGGDRCSGTCGSEWEN